MAGKGSTYTVLSFFHTEDDGRRNKMKDEGEKVNRNFVGGTSVLGHSSFGMEDKKVRWLGAR
jgi:hypothetical protein